MKILKSAGTFEVLNEQELISTSTGGAIWKIARAARTCYQSEEFATEEKDDKLVKHLLKRGHHAMIEFGGTMIVQFNNVCRGFTHEMVRHRLCSFAQESTRYVDESDFKVVVPPHKDEKENVIELDLGQLHFNNQPTFGEASMKLSLSQWLTLNEQAYRCLRKAGWKPEDARQVLPIAIKSQITVGANMREWIHIFDMRCGKAAHWEIRGVMLHLLYWCKTHIPIIYDNFQFFGGDSDTDKRYAKRVVDA